MSGCRRGDPKKAAIIVENSSTTRPQQHPEVKEADKPHVTQTLLMRAGDVESNPGPKRKHSSHSEKEDDFDDILEEVARLIPGNKNIDTLGKALGFDLADIERYIATNSRYQHVTYEGTLKMLRDWRNTQRKAEERPALVHALKESKLERLADMPLRTSKVPDLRTTSDDLQQDDLLKSVVKDIKKYYKLIMCTIQADPTNNDEMFEFNHIYTDPTLLEEDSNDITIRNPLHYCNLLETSHRLLVQAEGGAGKTTFCSKIAWDWVYDLGFQQFKLVAVIPLRKAKNKTVGDVIKSYLSDNNPFTAAQIDEYILSNQKDVFLVFDGLNELWGQLSDGHQISLIILNRLFMSGTVLVTSRQWGAHEICSNTELKKVYAFVYIEGFSFDNVIVYITKFFNQDAASSQELIDFFTSNNVIADNMAHFPIYIALLCIMWREYDGERREAMSKLMTFSQLFDEMVEFLVDHCGSKDDSQTGPTGQELRQMIPNHLKAIGEIAFQGILDRRLEFPEDAFQSCRESMEMGCKVGVLTREKHATPRRDRRKNPRLEMTMVQFPHKLFQEFMAAKYLASLYRSDHDRYERIMADILEKKEENRYLLYFTSAQGSELGLDIVTRLIDQEAKYYMDEAYESNRESSLPKMLKRVIRICPRLIPQERKAHFIVDVAFESQHQSVSEKVGNQLMRSRKTIEIDRNWSAHTVSGFMFFKHHLVKVDSLVLEKECGRTASQDLAEFILSSASLRTMRIGQPMHAVFYSMLADKVQQCQIQNLNVVLTFLGDRPLPSRDLAEFICQMPHLESLELCHNTLHQDFFSTWASIVSPAKGNKQSTTPHTSLRELIVDADIVFGWQSCGDMFDSVEKLSICFWCDFKCNFIQRLHGFQGVTELSIIGRGKIKSCRVKGEPSKMIKHLVRVFPRLIKMTFRIHLGNAILKQILESLGETQGSPLKSVRVRRPRMDDDLDELSALINRINDENVFRVEMEPLGKCEPTLEDSDKDSDDDDESGDKSDDNDECGDKCVDKSDDDSHIASDEHSFHERDESLATGNFGAIGGELSTRSHGFTLHIPPGALEEEEQISLQVLTEIPNGLTLKDDEILISHGFQCYPSGLTFKKPAKLIIPHCALVIVPNKVQTILYSWNQSGTPKRLQHSSNITCSVQERWLEISISHFSGGFFAVLWDLLFLKGILLSCMPFLPTVLPSNRQPVLEVRFVMKPHGQKWNNVHVFNSSRFQPVKDDDDDIVFRRSTLTVSCQLGGKSPAIKDIQRNEMSSGWKVTEYFTLDLRDKSNDTLVTLKLVQTTTKTIIFNIYFQAQPSSVNQSLQSIDAANSSRVTGNTIIGSQTINRYSRYSHGSEDEMMDEPSAKRNKKTNQNTDSSDEDERTRRQKQRKSHGSKDDSLDGRPRKRKTKTNRQADSSD